MPPAARKPARVWPPSEVEAWATGLTDNYIACRDMGHTWRPLRAWWEESLKSYVRTLRCGRCRSERSQYVASNGYVDGNRYDYAEGYVKPKGTGRIDQEGSAALRLESILRLIGKDEVDSRGA